ncbi:MAG: MucR family transcriptional regulator [Alphaproteobacteria bacterium]|nr:MucR family transcriptional regulator [Alphaproteobacteria bacterium]
MSDDAVEKTSRTELLRMATEIVSAYVGCNNLDAGRIPEVIQLVYGSLDSLSAGGGGPETSPPRPMVSIRKSVTPDYIICLEDGKKLKMLKRHLRTTYGLTPEEYRAKWGLRAHYTMVSPNYPAQRSDFAKKIGLGKHGNAKRDRKARK